MTTGRQSASQEGRGTSPHIPVLLEAVLDALDVGADSRIIDATFGAGGYSSALLRAGEGVRILALDRDPRAIIEGRDVLGRAGGRLTLVNACFGDLAQIAVRHDFAPVDAVVLDIGVSSMQLDEPDRGFSFMADGPLDMRMGGDGPTAADLVAELEEAALADLIFAFGEERQSRRIARFIARQRESRRIATTAALAAVVERAIGRRPDDARHPATRTFQALRIAVNDELGELVRGLAAAERVLKPGGRLVVVTFHSLEDRIVKRFLARRSGRQSQGSRHGPPQLGAERSASFRLINHRPVTPGEAEREANPRARSAKLRAAVRLDAPAWPAEPAAEMGLPMLRGGP